jgi:hypothetical protein
MASVTSVLQSSNLAVLSECEMPLTQNEVRTLNGVLMKIFGPKHGKVNEEFRILHNLKLLFIQVSAVRMVK